MVGMNIAHVMNLMVVFLESRHGTFHCASCVTKTCNDGERVGRILYPVCGHFAFVGFAQRTLSYLRNDMNFAEKDVIVRRRTYKEKYHKSQIEISVANLQSSRTISLSLS